MSRNTKKFTRDITRGKDNRAGSSSNRGRKSSNDRRTKYCSSEPVFDKNASKSAMEDIHSNDISWWNQSPIYKDATSVPQNRFPGYFNDDRVLMHPDGFGHLDNMPTETVTALPSVMVLEYVPTIGYSDGATSPINRSFTSLYAQIAAHTNSGNLGFTMATLAMLSIAAYSVAMTVGHAKRILGLRRVWDNSNGNMPKGILEALGMTERLTEIDWERRRVDLNTLIDSFNSLQLPRYVSILDRAFQLGYNVYADEDSTEAQFYAFKSLGFYVYMDTENKSKYITFNEFLSEYQDEYPGLRAADPLHMYICALDLQLKALRSTADLGIVMGAYRRAFPASAAMQFAYFGADEVCVPWYDRNMLWQINNADIIPGTIFGLDVEENVAQDIILSTPHVRCYIAGGTGEGATGASLNAFKTGPRYLNSFNGEWSDEFVMEATRLKVVVDKDTGVDNPGSYGDIRICGTEIVNSVQVYQPRLNSVPAVRRYPAVLITEHVLAGKVLMNPNFTGNATTGAAFLFDLVALEKFRNRPLIYCYQFTAGTSSELPTYAQEVEGIGTAVFVGVLNDLYKYALINEQQLEQIHLAALQSAYLINVPTNWN